MGSRLYPLVLLILTLLADAASLHRLSFYLVLLAVPLAAGAAFLAAADTLAGKGETLRAVSSSLALLAVVTSCVSRSHAVPGTLPVLATSALVGALLAYGVPLVAWLFEPLRPSPKPRTRVRIRTNP
jgi:hypothetical protein